MPTKEIELLKEVNEKLGTVVELMLYEKLENKDTNKDKIELLSRFHFSDKEIAELIGTSESSVSTVKTELRKEDRIK